MGYNPIVEEYDPKLAHALKYNIAEFSAFKETSFKKQIESHLTKGNKVLSWSEFKKEVAKLDIQYNRQWLKTEYDQTIANANSAEKFKEYQSQKHLYPNLEYKTIGDERVRSSHKSMDGIILPVDDPFWQKFMPPNDWGCRCYVLQTTEPVNQPKENDLSVKNDFANNPAVSGKIFKENAYEKGLSKKEVERAKELAKKGINKIEKNKILTKPRKEQFKKISKNVYEHLLTNKIDDYQEIKQTAKLLSKNGKITELMPEIYKNEVVIRKVVFKHLPKTFKSNPDLRNGNLYYDLKRPKSIRKIFRNSIKASKQGAIAIISDSQLDNPLTDKIMINRAKHIFQSEEYKQDVIIFKKGDKLITFKRKDVN